MGVGVPSGTFSQLTLQMLRDIPVLVKSGRWLAQFGDAHAVTFLLFLFFFF